MVHEMVMRHFDKVGKIDSGNGDGKTTESTTFVPDQANLPH